MTDQITTHHAHHSCCGNDVELKFRGEQYAGGQCPKCGPILFIDPELHEQIADRIRAGTPALPTAPKGRARLGGIIGWTIRTGTFAALLYLATIAGISGAANVAVVYVWMTAILGAFCLSSEVVRARQQKGLPAVPAKIDFTIDLLLVGYMTWHGWLFLGTVYLIGSACALSLHVPLAAKPAAAA